MAQTTPEAFKLEGSWLDSVLKFISGLSIIVGFGGSIATAVGIAPGYNRLLVIIALGGILLAVGALVWADKRRRSQLQDALRQADNAFNKKFSITAEKLHLAMHTIRDELDKLLLYWNDGKISQHLLEEVTVNTGRQLVNWISDFLSECTGDTVCVCIKILEGTPGRSREAVALSEDDLQNIFVTTLCRNSETPRRRFRQNRHRVALNTGFRNIMLGDDYFACSDLVQLANDGKYDNTTENWRDDYKCAIVVPIRIFIGEVTQAGTLRRCYDWLAFLCADGNVVNGFEPDRLQDYANLLMAVGDALFHYLDVVSRCQQSLAADTGDTGQ